MISSLTHTGYLLPLFWWRPGILLLLISLCCFQRYMLGLRLRYATQPRRCWWHLYWN